MSDICPSCEGKIHESESWLLCSECKCSYHIGSCSAVTDNAYKKKSAAAKKSWTCVACKAPTRVAQTAEVQNGAVEKKFASELAEIHHKLTELLGIKVKVDALLEIKITVDKIEESMEVMSSKYDEVLAQMAKQSAEMSDLRKRVMRLEAQDKQKDVEKLQQELNELDQYSRRLNLEVNGLTYHENENLLAKLNQLATDLKLPQLSESDIEAAHRVPSRNERTRDKPNTVIVRFASRKTKEKWLEKKGELKKAKSAIFFSENLTAYNKNLFWQMKTKALENNYNFAWHKNGKLFVRRSPNDRLIRIATAQDLEKIR